MFKTGSHILQSARFGLFALSNLASICAPSLFSALSLTPSFYLFLYCQTIRTGSQRGTYHGLCISASTQAWQPWQAVRQAGRQAGGPTGQGRGNAVQVSLVLLAESASLPIHWSLDAFPPWKLSPGDRALIVCHPGVVTYKTCGRGP